MNQSLEVRLEPHLKPTREREVDVESEVHVKVQTRMTGIGITGIALMALGTIALVVGASMFIAAYPEVWKATGSVTEGETLRTVEATIITLAAGVTGILLGASMFFHGRQVLGSGSLERLSLMSQLEAAQVAGVSAAIAANPSVPTTAAMEDDAAAWAPDGAIHSFGTRRDQP